MDVSAIHHARNARRGWKVIGIFAAAVLLLAAVVLFIFFKDDPPPDDSRMLPAFSVQRKDNNPLSEFAEYVIKNPPQGEAWLSKSARERAPEAAAEMQQHVDKNAALLARWDELMASDAATWRWPMDREETNYATKVPYLSTCQEIANRIALFKADLFSRDGKTHEAIALAQKISAFGQAMQQAEGSGLPWLVGLTIRKQSLLLLESLLIEGNLGDQDLNKIQTQLAAQSPQLRDLKFVLQMEYLSFKNTIGNLRANAEEMFSGLDTPNPLLFLLVRKNRTFNEYQSLLLPLAEASEKSPSDLCAESKLLAEKLTRLRSQNSARPFHSNAGGQILLTIGLPIYTRFAEQAVQSMAHHRIAVAMIAIRRYELANQKLPQALTELVPTYLPEVPTDPFDDKPLRWNPDTLVLHSISSNLSDEGGVFERSAHHREPDYGTYYWWSDKAKDQCEKEKLKAK